MLTGSDSIRTERPMAHWLRDSLMTKHLTVAVGPQKWAAHAFASGTFGLCYLDSLNRFTDVWG